MNKIDVSVSFDTEHDKELYNDLLEQSQQPGSTFQISSCSERFAPTDVWTDRVRRRIGRAAQIIIICGEHTDESQGVFTELRIAREEHTPYFMLWGRRDRMCTKPLGAKPSEGMYGWTLPTIQDQLAQANRKSIRDTTALALKRPNTSERAAEQADGTSPVS